MYSQSISKMNGLSYPAIPKAPNMHWNRIVLSCIPMQWHRMTPSTETPAIRVT